MEEPPRIDTGDSPHCIDPALDAIIPDNPMASYDMKDVIHSIVDNGNFFEVHEHYAQNILVGFARLDGRTIGIIANQPAVLSSVQR